MEGRDLDMNIRKKDLGLSKWLSAEFQDGYVVGNGKMCMVAGLGRELCYEKWFITENPAPLTRIAAVIGPSYAASTAKGLDFIMGYGWDIRIINNNNNDNNNDFTWESEQIKYPTENCPFWGVVCENKYIHLEVIDMILPDETVILRKIRISPLAGYFERDMTALIPVKEIQGFPGKLCSSKHYDKQNKAIILKMDQEVSKRVLVTTADSCGHDCIVDEEGIKVILQKSAKEKEIDLWLVTSNSGQDDFLLKTIRSTVDLCRATQSSQGGNIASPYMYPNCYVRDQQGPFRLFLAVGDYDRAYKALAFHTAMQNRYGIRLEFLPGDSEDNPDPFRFNPGIKWMNTRFASAEYPSYMNIFVRDYYNYTGNLEFVSRLYDKLAFNIRCQEFGESKLLHSPTDESYTQLVGLNGPLNFTDSNLLFIEAAKFAAKIAKKLGFEKDAEEFDFLAKRTFYALMVFCWHQDEKYFAMLKEDSQPLLDSLLRWFWIEMGDPQDVIPSGCLKKVLDCLVNPIRVKAERTTDVFYAQRYTDKQCCCGFDPGYILYAMARSQHPQVHEAAELLLRYAGRNGTFSEYYHYSDEGYINPIIKVGNGSLRPWETGTCGAALAQYILGMRIDLPNKTISLAPHLPKTWPGWVSKAREIIGEGVLITKLKKEDDHNICFSIERYGGNNTLFFEVEFGAFGDEIHAISTGLSNIDGRPDILHGRFPIAPSEACDIRFCIH